MIEQMNFFDLAKQNNKKPDEVIPKGVKFKKGQLWCPYCSKPVIFKRDEKLGVKKCTICGISNRDYHVKMVNKIW